MNIKTCQKTKLIHTGKRNQKARKQHQQTKNQYKQKTFIHTNNKNMKTTSVVFCPVLAFLLITPKYWFGKSIIVTSVFLSVTFPAVVRYRIRKR